jgi:hypothetical protein
MREFLMFMRKKNDICANSYYLCAKKPIYAQIPGTYAQKFDICAKKQAYKKGNLVINYYKENLARKPFRRQSPSYAYTLFVKIFTTPKYFLAKILYLKCKRNLQDYILAGNCLDRCILQ